MVVPHFLRILAGNPKPQPSSNILFPDFCLLKMYSYSCPHRRLELQYFLISEAGLFDTQLSPEPIEI